MINIPDSTDYFNMYEREKERQKRIINKREQDDEIDFEEILNKQVDIYKAKLGGYQVESIGSKGKAGIRCN